MLGCPSDHDSLTDSQSHELGLSLQFFLAATRARGCTGLLLPFARGVTVCF